MSSQDMNDLRTRAQYVLGLLGRKRRAVVRDITDSDNKEDNLQYLQYDLMAQMVDSGLKLDDEVFTETIEAQREVEEEVKKIYEELLEKGEDVHLYKAKHIRYLKAALGQLPHMFKSLDASQPWLIYWMTVALKLLGTDLSSEVAHDACERVLSMFHEDGGIGGGMGQIGHAASAYSGINALVILGDERVWSRIDREKMYKWLMALKTEEGAFCMHVGGEFDTRAVYCVLSIASLLGIMTPELTKGTAEWLSKCQTYEGGFGGVPYDEAHGGYTFCAAASMILLGKETFKKHVNLPKLVEWVAFRQLSLEGGFSGRTNKLVDGCYSYWVGGVVPIFDLLLNTEVISRAGLQNYIMGCCQNAEIGGLRDKPSKRPDFYHSTYVLLGLSVAQKKYYMDEELLKQLPDKPESLVFAINGRPEPKEVIKIDEEDVLCPVNPILALPIGAAQKFRAYFDSKSK